MELFPFHLFIFNPNRKKASLIVSANSPLTEEKKAMILKFVKLGGVPAIKSTQKLTFMNFLELPENEQKRLENMNKFILKRIETSASTEDSTGDDPLDDLDKMMDDNSDMFEEEPPAYDETPRPRFNSSGSLSFELTHPYSSDLYAKNLRLLFNEDFMPLIKELRQDIEGLDSKVHTATEIKIAKVLSDRFLNFDNVDTRVAAITHLFIKKLEISDPNVICSAFITSMSRNIGLTQVPRDVIRHRDLENEKYENHPTTSSTIISNSHIEIAPEITSLILESHAIGGGLGHPIVRNPETLDPIESAFLFASYIIESCYTFPKTKIGNIKSTFQEYQGSKDKSQKIFGSSIIKLFEKDLTSKEKEDELMETSNDFIEQDAVVA